jgi:hypothetical protein
VTHARSFSSVASDDSTARIERSRPTASGTTVSGKKRRVLQRENCDLELLRQFGGYRALVFLYLFSHMLPLFLFAASRSLREKGFSRKDAKPAKQSIHFSTNE